MPSNNLLNNRRKDSEKIKLEVFHIAQTAYPIITTPNIRFIFNSI